MKYKTYGTLSQKAYEFLKEQIVYGKIKDGEIITEKGVGEHLNMSRTPVRKALTQLEIENYVKCIDGVGSIVVGLSIKDLADIYEVRKNIEALALKTSIEKISNEELGKEKEKFIAVLENCDKGISMETNDLTEIDLNFHNIIVKNSQNNYVKTLMHTIHNQIERYQHEAYALTDTVKESARQHLNIIESIEKKDYDEAKKNLMDHIDWSFGVLSNALSNLN